MFTQFKRKLSSKFRYFLIVNVFLKPNFLAPIFRSVFQEPSSFFDDMTLKRMKLCLNINTKPRNELPDQ